MGPYAFSFQSIPQMEIHVAFPRFNAWCSFLLLKHSFSSKRVQPHSFCCHFSLLSPTLLVNAGSNTSPCRPQSIRNSMSSKPNLCSSYPNPAFGLPSPCPLVLPFLWRDSLVPLIIPLAVLCTFPWLLLESLISLSVTGSLKEICEPSAYFPCFCFSPPNVAPGLHWL